jgi:type IV secretory pathway VirB4 component
LSQPDQSIRIGEEITTLDSKPKGVARIPLEALRRHVCILGTTGSGKSNCAKVIGHELDELGVPTVVLDRTGEYAEAFAAKAGVKSLTPGENLVTPIFKLIDKADREGVLSQIEDWVSLLDHFNHVSNSAGLSPLQARILREVLLQHYQGASQTLTISGLISKLRAYEKHAGNLNGWSESIEALVSRLWPMTVDGVGEALDRSYETFRIEEFLEPRLKILDLSKLRDDRAKNLLSQVLLKHLNVAVRSRGQTAELRVVVVIDEAQHLAPNERGYISLPENFAIELRKYGLSLVTCASRPSLVSPNIIANSNTVISFMLNNMLDIETVAGFFVGGTRDNHIRDMLRQLPVGEAMLQLNHPVPKSPARCRVARAMESTAMENEPLPVAVQNVGGRSK